VKRIVIAALAAAGFAAVPVLAQSPGVTKSEIVVGSIQDLSGPIAGYGKALRNGLQFRVDAINEAGGINGRKIKLVVEDSGYDPKKAVLAAQKLVQKDRVFAVAGTVGTPINLAAMPIQFEKNVLNFLPIASSREMFEPISPLKWSFAATYFDQVRTGSKWLIKAKGSKAVCVLYQDDDFGQEILHGTEAGLKEIGMQVIERTSFKRGATDFSSQVQRLRNANCDLVVLGTIIRETIGAVGEARKIGWGVEFLGSSAAYDTLIPKLGGKMMDGFYTMNTVNFPYMDDASKNLREWGQAYKARFNEEPTIFSVYGDLVITLFADVAGKAGPSLTTETFIAAMEKYTRPRDMFGSDEIVFSKTKHLGTNRARLSQIQNGKWVQMTDYLSE
jgi:branched-chain amino acid transport system substrate-binding protein